PMCCTLRLPPQSALFPYTTLFRSSPGRRSRSGCRPRSPPEGRTGSPWRTDRDPGVPRRRSGQVSISYCFALSLLKVWGNLTGTRSEEHTSELQSRENLVYRLLLEK